MSDTVDIPRLGLKLIPVERRELTPLKIRIPRTRVSLETPADPRILDFDVETVAAGFADPQWVPQKITCVAWSWVGEEQVHSRICGPLGLYTHPQRRKRMLQPLLKAISQADWVTGHNLLRFDLGVINADAMRLGLEPIRQVEVEDTMRLVRAKGFKKGQDNLGKLYKLVNEKLALDWQGWEDAYAEPGWPTVRERCESDVRMHKELRLELIERNLLGRRVTWKGEK